MNDADIQELLAPAAQRPLPPLSFSLDDVVRQGTSVRRRRRAASVAAILAVVVLVTGGFVVLRSESQARPAAPLPTLAEQRAGRVLDYALTIVPLPADAHVTSPVSGVKPNQPAPLGPSVHRTVWYVTGQPPSEVVKWMLAHDWAAGWNGGASADPTQADGDLSWGGQFGQVQNVDTPAPALQVTVRKRGGMSIVRLDGWQQPQPLLVRDTDTLVGPATSVDVARGSDGTAAYSSTLTLTLTGARAAALAKALDALPVAWAPSDRKCTAAQSTTFTFRVGAGVLVFTDQPVCGVVLVSLNGKPEPALTAFDLSLKNAVAGLAG